MNKDITAYFLTGDFEILPSQGTNWERFTSFLAWLEPTNESKLIGRGSDQNGDFTLEDGKLTEDSFTFVKKYVGSDEAIHFTYSPYVKDRNLWKGLFEIKGKTSGHTFCSVNPVRTTGEQFAQSIIRASQYLSQPFEGSEVIHNSLSGRSKGFKFRTFDDEKSANDYMQEKQK